MSKTEEARATLRKQLRQLGEVRKMQLNCGKCDKPTPMMSLYRCFECGIWFCTQCGAEHWPEAADNRKKRQEAWASGNVQF